jgi:SET domain-containing protein
VGAWRQNPAITFNYQPKPLEGILKVTPPLSSSTQEVVRSRRISYYSSNEIYALDEEIAADLQRFLGYSPLS